MSAHNEYMLIFRSDEWYNSLSPEELQTYLNQCKAWFDHLAGQGYVKGGQPLAREGARISGKNGSVVTDGPFVETKEAIGGYLLLQAESFEKAVAIAKSSPGLAYGVTIEVRPVAEECPLNARARQLADEKQLVHA